MTGKKIGLQASASELLPLLPQCVTFLSPADPMLACVN